MSLLFGNLVNSFVNFGAAVEGSGGNFSNSTVIAAAQSFKSNAATDAAALVYVGVGILVTTYIYMVIWVHNGTAYWPITKFLKYDAHCFQQNRRGLGQADS